MLLDSLNELLDLPCQLTGRADNGNNARYESDVSMRKLPVSRKIGIHSASGLTSDLHAGSNYS